VTVPDLLSDIVPTVGSTWCWGPLKPHARETVRVTDVRWNGEEVWIESEGQSGRRYWNELSRWIEATVLVDLGASDRPFSARR
jgi:hypothetical protein